jgi:phenylpropionate dioxygenase-like ring-hydroxylating dioxygenase large terminal subunit
VDDVLAGAECELADYGLGDYVHVETRTREWRMNWKLVLDTFAESYHIRFLHHASIGPHFMCDTLFDAFGPNLRVIGLRKDVVEQLQTLPREQWALLPYGTVQYFLVPNGLLVYQRDHVEVWRIEPLDVDRVSVATSLYASEAPRDEKARAYWRKNLDLLLQVTGTEDFPLMEEIQRNLASGALPEVVYGRIEPALAHLHAAIDAALL